MNRSALVAWGIFGLSLATMVAALVVWAGGTGEPLTADIVLYPLAYLAFGGVGALIVTRHTANRRSR